MPYAVGIDSEFLHLTIPVSEERTKKLKNSILQRGCKEPIRTWNGIIIDGHKRYSICSKGKRDYAVMEMDFPSRDEAIIWACKERVVGTAPGSAINKYLIGKHYQCAKRIAKRQKKQDAVNGINQAKITDGRPIRVSEILGELYKINHVTVEKYGVFAEMMDVIASKNEEFFESMMNEKIHASHNTILDVAKLDSKSIKIFLNKSIKSEEAKEQKKLLRIKGNDQSQEIIPAKKDYSEIPLSVGIKNMPAYDPDMELKVLALTIPTWINSLDKAMAKAELSLVSERTKAQLNDSLQRLEWQILLAREIIEK